VSAFRIFKEIERQAAVRLRKGQSDAYEVELLLIGGHKVKGAVIEIESAFVKVSETMMVFHWRQPPAAGIDESSNIKADGKPRDGKTFELERYISFDVIQMVTPIWL
jgi:hypothetical protein